MDIFFFDLTMDIFRKGNVDFKGANGNLSGYSRLTAPPHPRLLWKIQIKP